MRPITAGWTRLFLVAISLSAASGYADTDTAVEPQFPVEELSAACEEARANFRPLTLADLKEARTELTDAVDRLDKRLLADAQNGPNWREYLLWDRMKEQILPEATPDPGVLFEVCKKYRAGHRGLKLAWFADVRGAIERYRLIARAVDSSKTRASFKKILTGLPDYIEAYQLEPTVELALSIGNALKWLEARRQVPELVARLRRELGHPNMLFQVSDDMLKALLAGPAEDKSPVRDVILGTSLYGTGHTTGQVEARLISDGLSKTNWHRY